MKYFVVSLVVQFLFPLFVSAEVVERIVAIVNSEIITLTDMNSYKEKLRSGGLVDDVLLKLSDSKSLVADNKLLLQHLVNEKLFDSEIRKQSIQVTVEQVEKEIRNIAQKNGISKEQLMTALKEQGVDVSEYQDFLKTTLERQSLIEREISSKIKISDGEVSEYYLKHSSNSKRDDQFFEYELSHILFLKKNGGTAAAETRAIEIYGQLASGKDFSDLASKFSEDPNFTQGGILGTFKPSEMNAQLSNAVSKLEPGQFSKVLLAGENYQIVRVNKKRVVANPHLEAQRPQIQSVLFEKAFKTQLKDWLDRKRQEAFVKVNI